MACCGQGRRLAERLEAIGVGGPATRVARMGAKAIDRTWRWHLVDGQGYDLQPPVGSSCLPSVLRLGPLRVVDRGHLRHVHGSEPCGWG